MEKTYAYVNKTSYLIENMVVWDGVSPFVPPNGFEFVEVPAEGMHGDWSPLGIGWAYVNGEFIEPPNPDPNWKTAYKSIVGDVPNVIA